MNVKIKEFEKHVIDEVSELRILLGAKSVDINVHVDNYNNGCTIDVTFITSNRKDPGCGGACKVD